MLIRKDYRTTTEGPPRGKTYPPSGRLIGKSRSNSSVTLSASADMAYGYCDDYQPHAVKRMFNYNNGMLYDMRWDEAGNLGQVSMSKPGEMFEAGRFLFWTEDNRMHTAVDDKHYSYYAYDYGGERRLKLVGVNSSVDVNAEYMTAVSTLNEPTLYPSAYMVLTNRGYTKHYYAGTERVAARLGGGGLDAIGHAIGSNDTLLEKADLLYKQSLDQVNNRVLLENDLDCIMNSKFAKEEFGHPIDDVPSRMQAGVEPNHDQFKDMMNSMLSDLSQGDEPDVYFYHSDLCKSREQSQAGLSYAETQQSVRSKHLGSASWITDFSGMAVQHIQYLPYGEPYINQRLSGYNERFTFTGKERDEETGYGYFGARYMDHELMTMWLSVDPMSDKYPSISPYAYCAWNPVKLVDPDGNDWVENKETGDVTWNKNVTSPSTTPEGYIYRGRDYVRDKIWTQQKVGNKYVSGLIREHYKTNGKMEYKNLTPWIQTAFDEMNKKIIENGANPEVLKYFAHTQLAGTEYAATDKTPWCAAFVNYCLESVSIPGSGYATASSFKNYGDNMGTTPTYGSIAIMNYSHVGFIIGQDNKGRIIILGGNQGEPGGVNLGTNPKENVVRYVYPSSHVPTQLNLPTLSVTNRELDYTNTR